MAQNYADDVRTDKIKQAMAEHFAEFEADYRDADWSTVVYEDDEVILIADHKGYEFDEWAGDLDMTAAVFTGVMHNLAGQLSDRSWAADYPLVFDKLE